MEELLLYLNNDKSGGSVGVPRSPPGRAMASPGGASGVETPPYGTPGAASSSGDTTALLESTGASQLVPHAAAAAPLGWTGGYTSSAAAASAARKKKQPQVQVQGGARHDVEEVFASRIELDLDQGGAPGAAGVAGTSTDPMVRELLGELRGAARQLRTRAPLTQAPLLVDVSGAAAPARPPPPQVARRRHPDLDDASSSSASTPPSTPAPAPAPAQPEVAAPSEAAPDRSGGGGIAAAVAAAPRVMDRVATVPAEGLYVESVHDDDDDDDGDDDAAASAGGRRAIRPVRAINPSAEYAAVWGAGRAEAVPNTSRSHNGHSRHPRAAAPTSRDYEALEAQLRATEERLQATEEALALEKEQHRQMLALVAGLIPSLDFPSGAGRQDLALTSAPVQPRSVARPVLDPPRSPAPRPAHPTNVVGGMGDRMSASMERSLADASDVPSYHRRAQSTTHDAPPPPPALGGGVGGRVSISSAATVARPPPPRRSTRSRSPLHLPPRAPREESPTVSPQRPRRAAVPRHNLPAAAPPKPATPDPPAGGLSAFSSITPICGSANSSQMDGDFGIRSTLSQLKNLVGMT
eukprot:TRINITY_DN10879_c0_g2_i1.p1 TRINITY_DN10879_c0_g2~~TRINITY_DN10879_c0_g2_i1.p1  ORF type:complete len:580 (+),score=166.31 TRINITY_DN10879_c0_g2_i1:27-1766(+)